MSITQQLELSKSRVGRIELHIRACFRDHNLKCHLQGIKRELFPLTFRKPSVKVLAT